MNRAERIGLACALLGALLIRVLLVYSLRDQPYFQTPVVDSASFDRRAVQIAAGDPAADRAFFQDPLYAYFLAAFYTCFGRDLLAVRLLQALLGTFGLWMLFEGVRRLWGWRAGMAALLIGGFSKTLIFFDAMLLKDFLGVIALEGAVLCYALSSRWKWAGLGLCLGVGSLVRGNLLLLVPAAALCLLIQRERRAALLLAAGALLAILPATIRNAVVAGEFVPVTTHAGVNLYIGNNPENASGRYRPPSFLRAATPEAEEEDFRLEAERRLRRPLKPGEVDRYWRGEALSHIAGHPGEFAAVTLKRALMLLSSYEIPDDHDPYFMARFSWILRLPLFTFGLFTLPLAAAGFYLAWQERPRPHLLYVLAGAYAASIAIFFIFGRYRLPLVPLLLAFAGFAVARFPKLLEWRLRAVPRTAAGVFAAVLLVSNLPLPAALAGHRDFRTAHRNLGLYYLEQNHPAEAVTEFEEAARLNPEYLKDPAYVWTLGLACEKAGQAPKAAELFGRAAGLDRESAEAPYRAGLIYFHEGMHTRAAEWLAETLRRDPAFTAAAAPLAEALRRSKQLPEALEVLDAALLRAPKDPALRLARGTLYLELSMWGEAAAEAGVLLQQRPDDPEAKRLLEAARRRAR